MASTRTPLSGTTAMYDLDKSIVRSWTTPTSNQSLLGYNNQDFNPGTAPNGFAYCYGNPGVGTPIRLSDYRDLLGWVDYSVKAINVNNVNVITVDINPMNGSNGTPPAQLMLTTGTNLPNGDDFQEGAHWETLQFVVTVGGMTGGSFDVYFDGTYIDTIIMDGIYVYDNGGLGYVNGYGSGTNSDRVVITFQ